MRVSQMANAFFGLYGDTELNLNQSRLFCCVLDGFKITETFQCFVSQDGGCVTRKLVGCGPSDFLNVDASTRCYSAACDGSFQTFRLGMSRSVGVVPLAEGNIGSYVVFGCGRNDKRCSCATLRDALGDLACSSDVVERVGSFEGNPSVVSDDCVEDTPLATSHLLSHCQCGSRSH